MVRRSPLLVSFFDFSHTSQLSFCWMSWKRHIRWAFPSIPTAVPHIYVMKDVSMILLQILDEGSITDSQGRKVDFKVRTSPHHSGPLTLYTPRTLSSA